MTPEHRESLALEKAIKDDPAGCQAWLNKQLIVDPVVLDETDEGNGNAWSGTHERAANDLCLRALPRSSEDPDRLRLAFELPSGSYATMLVRELTRAVEAGPRSDG